MSSVELLLVTLLLMALAYACGGWLGALSVCRWAGVRDPRLAGSRNPGFSNVLRLYGSRLALATLLLDAAKGMPALLLSKGVGLPAWAQGLVGLGVLLGHSYPLWHRFRGGKAVASAFGVLLVLTPWVALLCALLWALLAWRVRTAAVASLATACLAPMASWWLAPDFVWVVSAFALLVVARHVWSIRRLGGGGELRFRRRGVRPPEE
ncbi:acyl-phosphate glycerol-3-phosphate acyltransferase [Franzmannia pantelleriensis]|uniref:Glycerol-3-phosphate acyltransferase n=1 Tax=Franzmannia pantelleriensis TaxID=48727 RepID=A0A1G9PW48_9GAMM|nr:glycerol-3-phosphate 1-O-acyltransferase PlsY [Halomonas pantelleriensis]SDM02335.1 acyl-phosphate glycerol-3-phosphate acyltransferase [Halomonas pantelleriensis]